MVDWDSVVCASGYAVDKIPKDLVEILESLDETVKDANSMKFGDREDFGLYSTQVIGLVVMLWKMGLFISK